MRDLKSIISDLGQALSLHGPHRVREEGKTFLGGAGKVGQLEIVLAKRHLPALDAIRWIGSGIATH
jgi:hypothetical protein